MLLDHNLHCQHANAASTGNVGGSVFSAQCLCKRPKSLGGKGHEISMVFYCETSYWKILPHTLEVKKDLRW